MRSKVEELEQRKEEEERVRREREERERDKRELREQVKQQEEEHGEVSSEGSAVLVGYDHSIEPTPLPPSAPSSGSG